MANIFNSLAALFAAKSDDKPTEAKQAQEPVAPPVEDPQKIFDDQWYLSLDSFAKVCGIDKLDLTLKDPETGEAMKPHYGLVGVFEEWQKIKSPWDKRCILFDTIANYIGKQMTPWQFANFLVYTRRAHQALQLLKESVTVDSPEKIHYGMSFAKTCMAMTDYDNALKWAEEAYNIDPQNAECQLLYADSLYLLNRTDEADKVYTSILEANQSPQTEIVSEICESMFSIQSGIAHSPVLAVILGESLANPEQSAEYWSMAEVEFYYSPHFRMTHAYVLLNKGEINAGIAKLAYLVQEMPWIKEAHMNLITLLNKFDPENSAMPELKEEIEKRIKNNNWTADGLNIQSISSQNS